MRRLLPILALSFGHIAAAECPELPEGGPTQPTAIQVVFGPLAVDGDPRVAHHIEHILAAPRTGSCPIPGELDAWTGPDTIHLVWRGQANPDIERTIVEQLTPALGPPPIDPSLWDQAAHEVDLERRLTEPSASERLLHHTAAVGSRYRLPLRGAVGPPTRLASVFEDAPVTVIIARSDEPVRWRRSTPLDPLPASITAIDHPPEADLAWSVDGTLDCTHRRALWAALAGVAEDTGGTPIGWLGWRGGVLGVASVDTPRWSVRRARAAAEAWDQAAVRMTQRRARAPGDRTWMAAGVLGLGVCPALEPLSRQELRMGVEHLRETTPIGATKVHEDSVDIDIPTTDWAAIWQAGEPPDGWLDHPHIFGTRTPGGFTLDGPVDHLAQHTISPAQHRVVSPDDPIEQALVLTGAVEVEVPCRVQDAPAHLCPEPGRLRSPRGTSVVIVDTPNPPFVRVDQVVAHGSTNTFQAVVQHVHRVETELAAVGAGRDLTHLAEPIRSHISVHLPLAQVGLVGRFLPETAPAAVVMEPLPVDLSLRARPWEAVHQPTGTHPSPSTPTGHLLVVTGPAAPIQAALTAQGVPIDRILTAAQLAAEASAIRTPEN